MEPTTTAFGTWNGGRFMHYGEPLDDDLYIAAVHHAYEQGIRTFLTADVYGSGEADTLIGRSLAGFPRDTYCLVGAVGHDFYEGKREGAKGFPRFTDPKLRGESEYGEYLRMATEKSLGRIGVESFDLLLLHNPDFIGYTSPAVWEGMRAVREAGLTAQLGIAPGPANGFTLDLIGCFETFGEDIDWAMVILNPFEPWPGGLCLEAAEKHGIKVITRVVDYGGIFHDDVKPGHTFAASDHRLFRPGGWVEEGVEKLEKLRPLSEKHGLSMLQFACAWDLAQPAVACVVPTLIQEVGEHAVPITAKIDQLASLDEDAAEMLTEEDLALVAKVGNNKGCMPLKGGSRQFQGPPSADQWPITPELEEVAKRWGIHPDRDLFSSHDPRDMREKGMALRGVPQLTDRRLFVQLHVFTGASPGDAEATITAVEASGLASVVYADANDPRGLAVLILDEDPDTFAGRARALLSGEPFTSLTALPEMTMSGRTYGFGREPDVEHWLLRRPVEHATNPDWPWAIWYPLRRKGAFYSLPKPEQMEILKEHGTIGFRYGGAGYAGDIRLACFGMDREDNEFVLGIMGPRLEWLSKLVEDMRPTVQTSQFMDKLGPFFVGKVLFQSAGVPERESRQQAKT
ncbi:hypothetical protein BH23VER1_BH23VER1_01900 [soil metagenome]